MGYQTPLGNSNNSKKSLKREVINSLLKIRIIPKFLEGEVIPS